MFRYVSIEQSPRIETISSLIMQKHPEDFVSMEGRRLHVSILSRSSARDYIGYQIKDGPIPRTTEAIKRIRQDLLITGSQTTVGIFSELNYRSNHLVINLESDIVGREIDFAYQALGSMIGRKITNLYHPHISLGKLVTPVNTDSVEAILATAADLCLAYLPEDGFVELNPISLTSPKK